MQAVFAGLRYGNRRLRGESNDAMQAQLPAARNNLNSLNTQYQSLQDKYQLSPPLKTVHSESFPPVKATALRMTINATGSGRAASLYELEAWARNNSDSVSNVALASLGSTASASSFALSNQTRHFDNLIDGSVDKRQAFPWVAASGGPAWVKIAFNQPHTLEKIVWHSGSSTPADYIIEILAPGASEWKPIIDTYSRIPRIEDQRPADKVRIDNLDRAAIQEMVELNGKIRTARSQVNRLSAGPRVYAASFVAEPESTWLLHRGDAMQRKERVKPGIPVALGNLNPTSPITKESERRVALTQFLTDSQNPLTARVIVNRVWQHHFGTGLVDTPSDFGKMGSTPSHPELLDWLAVRLIQSGWSLKELHRLIMSSRTYQQSSLPQSKALAIDAESRLLWRFPPRRLEAEAIRDSILHTSGKLNLKMGGRGFSFFNQRGGLSDYHPVEKFNEDGWRRMIYAHKVRMVSIDVFGAFDCPDAGQMKPKRTRSITPVQSLGLLNSPFIMRQSHFFAERLRAEFGDNPTSRIEGAFLLTHSRKPTAAELARLMALESSHGLDQVCRVLFNSSKFAYIQ